VSDAGARPPRTWSEVRADVARRLAGAGIANAEAEARWMTEEASGYAGNEWILVAASEPHDRPGRQLARMHERRLAGVPLQYVLGAWSFRGLDLMVDERVLIPRPETEVVVEVALEEAERLGYKRGARPMFAVEARGVVADLGTGSGAIALALEAELPEADVWATDASDDALAVARANAAGAGATRVRLSHGDWFDALPAELRGRIDVLVSNPPYIAEHEAGTLPAEVVEHEPRGALIAGPAGTEALAVIIEGAAAWLSPNGVLVCEIAPHQADVVMDLARDAGFTAVDVRPDLTGRLRVLVARRAAG
jgi:release factor glutamine methyltransferase